MKRLFLLALIAVAGLSHAQTTAAYNSYIAQYHNFANQFYVSPTGSGTACSQAQPCSMATALDLGNTGVGKAGPGNVIWFNDGTYNFSTFFRTYGTGNSSAHAAYVSVNYGGAQIVLNPDSSDISNPVWELQGEYVDVVGFDISITGPNASQECWGISSNYPQIFGNNTYAYNRIHDVPASISNCGNGTGGAAIETGSGSSGSNNNTITDNVIWNIGATDNQWTHGIYGDGSGDVISNNIVYGASGGGIQVYHNAQNEVIVNNTLVGNGCWGIVAGAEAGEPSMSGMYFANNIIMNTATGSNACSNGGRAGFAECDGANCTGASGNTITNNLFYNNITDVNISGGTDQSVNMVTANPLLVNVASPGAGGDFHFQSGSPAIAAGTHSNAPALDLDRNTRPNPPAIGAYDVASSGGGGAPFVQQCAVKSPSTAVTSLSCTMPNPVTAGDLLVAMDCYIIPEGSISVTDSNGATYAAAVQRDDASSIIGCAILYTANAAGGTPAITVHSTTATQHWFAVNEYSGVVASAPLDVTANGASNGVPSSVGTTGNFATTQNNELIVAMGSFGQGSVSPGSGYTPRFAQTTITPEDALAPTAGTYSATESSSQNTGWVMVAATFKLRNTGPAFVQQCAVKSPSTAVTSLSCTMPGPVTAGDLLVAMDCYITPEGTISVTDTNNETYVSAIQRDETSAIIGCKILYTANAVGGTTPTFTVHSTTATNHWFAVNEYSGIVSSAPLDVTAGGATDGNFSASAVTGNFTTAQSNELIVVMATFGQGTVSAGSGYTPRFAQTTITPEDRVVTSAGTYNATESSSQSTGWVILAATFKASQ